MNDVWIGNVKKFIGIGGDDPIETEFFGIPQASHLHRLLPRKDGSSRIWNVVTIMVIVGNICDIAQIHGRIVVRGIPVFVNVDPKVRNAQ